MPSPRYLTLSPIYMSSSNPRQCRNRIRYVLLHNSSPKVLLTVELPAMVCLHAKISPLTKSSGQGECISKWSDDTQYKQFDEIKMKITADPITTTRPEHRYRNNGNKRNSIPIRELRRLDQRIRRIWTNKDAVVNNSMGTRGTLTNLFLSCSNINTRFVSSLENFITVQTTFASICNERPIPRVHTLNRSTRAK